MKPATCLMVCLSLLGCGSSYQLHRAEGLEVHSFRLDYSNAHLIVADGQAVLFDTVLPAEAAALDTSLREQGFDPAELIAIVLSHGHADHAGAASYFQDRYGTRVYAGIGDTAMLAAGRNDTLHPTGAFARWTLESNQGARYPSTRADVWVEGPLDLAGIGARIVPVPGHTPGSLVLIAGELAFVGDLFRGGILGPSAEVHFYMEDLEDNRRDITHLLEELAPDATLFFCGHFGPVERPALKKLLREWPGGDGPPAGN